MPDYYSRPLWLARQARQLICPRRCPFCGRVLGFVQECGVCTPRLEELRRAPGMRLDPAKHYLGALSGAAAPYRYAGCVRRAVLSAKYRAVPQTAVELGVRMAALALGSPVTMRAAEPTPQPVPGLSLGYDCIVPVPPSGRRRGYNVPELMARPLAHALEVPLDTHAATAARRASRWTSASPTWRGPSLSRTPTARRAAASFWWTM